MERDDATDELNFELVIETDGVFETVEETIEDLYACDRVWTA